MASGDVSLNIEQDIDMDGSIDYTNSYSTLSGVCANGFISCNAGTWNNCIPYRWEADSNFRLNPSVVNMTDLSGCNCINNSCVSGVGNKGDGNKGRNKGDGSLLLAMEGLLVKRTTISVSYGVVSLKKEPSPFLAFLPFLPSDCRVGNLGP